MSESVVSAHPAPFECSSTLGKLAAALAKAQGEFPIAAQTGEGKVGKIGAQRSYKYSTLADMVAATRGPLAKHGLAVVQLPTLDSPGWAIVRTTLVHESGEWIAGAVAVPSTAEFGAAAHVIGSAISYARRYGYGSLLAIVTEDDDGHAAQDHAQERAQTRQQQQRAPESRGDAAANGNGTADWKTRSIAKLDLLFPSAKGSGPLQFAIASAVIGKPIETFEGWEDGRHWRKYLETLEKLSKADVNRISSEAFANVASTPSAGTLALSEDVFDPAHPCQQEPSALAQGA